MQKPRDCAVAGLPDLPASADDDCGNSFLSPTPTNLRAANSAATPQRAPIKRGSVYWICLQARPGINALHGLRGVLKIALRRFGLRCLALRELPDQDKTKWPWKGGKQEDPWQASAQITMKSADTGELFTWITTSWGGRRAIGNLLKTFAAQARKHSGQYPKVILKSRSEPHPDYGTIDKPILEIVDWAAFGDGAAPCGTPLREPQQALPPAQEVLLPPPKTQVGRGDMDDEIPFE